MDSESYNWIQKGINSKGIPKGAEISDNGHWKPKPKHVDPSLLQVTDKFFP